MFRRTKFVPSHNSRHRVAAIALYRALLSTGRKIPVPEELHRGPVHPVVHLMRKRFTNNATYTSSRIVYASMAAGYKFLTLFTKAQTPDSPEHREIISHLRTRFEESASSRAKAPPQKIPPNHGPPLLTKVSGPNEPPKYMSTIRPLPKTALRGDRKVPHVVTTADGQPFIRTRKPQPRVLSRAIGRKTMIYRKKIYRIVDLEDEIMPSAMLEDNWDSLMRTQMRAEGLDNPEPADGDHATYCWSLQLGRLYLERGVESIWKDWVARGNALQQIVNQERAMADQENGSAATPITASAMSHRGRDSDTVRSAAAKEKMPWDAVPILPTVVDPFLSSEWAAAVRRVENRKPENRPDAARKPEERSYKKFEGARSRGNTTTPSSKERMSAKITVPTGFDAMRFDRRVS
ncbi:hypothetical protein G7046_g3839 [Stylonectria norvegica]|nr:hypothetical protein G7046_g3839 [Stylonectria norvegica]